MFMRVLAVPTIGPKPSRALYRICPGNCKELAFTVCHFTYSVLDGARTTGYRETKLMQESEVRKISLFCLVTSDFLGYQGRSP